MSTESPMKLNSVAPKAYKSQAKALTECRNVFSIDELAQLSLDDSFGRNLDSVETWRTEPNLRGFKGTSDDGGWFNGRNKNWEAGKRQKTCADSAVEKREKSSNRSSNPLDDLKRRKKRKKKKKSASAMGRKAVLNIRLSFPDGSKSGDTRKKVVERKLMNENKSECLEEALVIFMPENRPTSHNFLERHSPSRFGEKDGEAIKDFHRLDAVENDSQTTLGTSNKKDATGTRISECPNRDGGVTGEGCSEKSSIEIPSVLVETFDSQTPPSECSDDFRGKLRRSSSLKTSKPAHGSGGPGSKKIVRFADALGLDLTVVRTYVDDVPRVPGSAYRDLHSDLPPSSEPSPPSLTLVPLFLEPGRQMDFIERVHQQNICLETVSITNSGVLAVAGFLRVRNLDYHKSVHVRYSMTNWKTFFDLPASYVTDSSDGLTDKFSFIIYGQALTLGDKMEFALKMDCRGNQYWDNNGGINYAFSCLPEASANGFFSSRTNKPFFRNAH